MGIIIRNDARLVNQTLRGNREAFGRLVERHLSTAYAVALSSLRNPTDAEDAAQEAFLKAYTKLDTLREPAKFLPWLISIVRRESVAILRVKKRDERADESAPEEAHVESPITARDRARVLQEALEGLDETSRTVLTLHYFAGKSTREISETLNITISAVKKRLERGRYSLGRQLAEMASEGDSAAKMKELRVELLSIIALVIPTWQAEAVGAAAVGASLGLGAWVSGGVAVAALVAAIALPQFLDSPPPMTSPTPAEAAVQEEEKPKGPIAQSGDTAIASARSLVGNRSDRDQLGTGDSRKRRSVAKRDVAEQPVTPTQPEEDLLEKPLSMTFESAHIAEMFAYVSERVSKPIIVDWRVLPIPHEWSDYFPQDFGTRIPEKFGAVEQEWNWPAEQTLAYVTDGQCEFVELRDVPVSYAMSTILAPMGLSYVVDDGFIWISASGYIAGDYAARRPDPVRVKQLEAILGSAISLTFEDEHISRILEFIGESIGMGFVLDYRAIRPLERLDLLQYEGDGERDKQRTRSVTEGAIPFFTVKDVPLEAVLFAVLTQLGLSYEVQDHYIFVSTAEQLSRDRGRWGEEAIHRRNSGPKLSKFLEGRIVDNLRDDDGSGFIDLSGGRTKWIQAAIALLDWPSGRTVGYDFPNVHTQPPNRTLRPVGYLPDIPVTIPVHSYLDILTRPMGLEWSITGETVRISYAR